jgi:hypothetical protein
VNMVGDPADMSEWRAGVSRKCTVAVDAQAQSMCSLHSVHMDPGAGVAVTAIAHTHTHTHTYTETSA